MDHFLTRAEALGIRDKVIVLIQSEMGRTPWYNATGGKDHWSVGSMMMLGQGIVGNRVVGATTLDSAGNDLAPVSVDPTTLEPLMDGIRIRPEHVHLALRELVGIADHPASQAFDLGLAPTEAIPGLLTL